MIGIENLLNDFLLPQESCVKIDCENYSNSKLFCINKP